MSDSEATDRIYAVLVALVILGIVGGIVYGLWDTGRTNAANTQEARLACIEAGGTWVGSPSDICFDPTPGAVLLPPMEDEVP